jgi:peptidoglycan/LPS O-acetylase OafA/YrhL
MVASIFFLGRWMQFAAGMAAAWIVATHWHEGGKLRSAWAGTLLFIGAIVLYILATTQILSGLPKALPVRDLLLAASFAVGIIAICATQTPVRTVFSNRVAAGLGFFSYSIFLIHQPTAWYLSEMFKKKLKIDGLVDFALLLSVGLVIVCAIAYVFFLLFEKPFLNSRQRVKSAPPAEPVLTPAAQQQPTP